MDLMKNLGTTEYDGILGYLFLELVKLLVVKMNGLSKPEDYPADLGPKLIQNNVSLNFDYIIVGGGTSGSILANKLITSKKGTVLVLEAGKTPSMTSDVPGFNNRLHDEAWFFKSEAQDNVCGASEGKVCYLVGGKSLGGSSTIGDMHYGRASRKDWENATWDYDNTIWNYKRLENFEYEGNYSVKYGKDGSIPLNLFSGEDPVRTLVTEAAEELDKGTNTMQDVPLFIQKGGCCGSTKRITIVGGWAWAWWLVTDVQRLSLEVMTLNPMCESVETAQGVPLTVTGVAQCKIMKADELLHTASEQFLGKSVKEVKSTILQTLEGHLRAILGTLTVEEVYRDRDQFAALVREVAAPDVGRMGIEILSFTIKDVYDEVQYLASLGKAQTAMVKRDADAGVAEANRDAGIKEAECQKSAMDIKYSTDTKIEDNSRMFKLQKANFDQEINTAKAEAQLAYELQAAKIRQKIRNEEIQIEVVERRKEIEVEGQEVLRKEGELNATVRLPAEAESYKVETLAEGRRTQTVQGAIAESEKTKMIGAAEAQAIAAVGKAEAESMRLKAAVYKQYGEAAKMALVLEALPKIAAELSAPLAKTEEIVLIGGSDTTTSEISRLVSQIPPAVNALTGVDLSKVLGKIPGATITQHTAAVK